MVKNQLVKIESCTSLLVKRLLPRRQLVTAMGTAWSFSCLKLLLQTCEDISPGIDLVTRALMCLQGEYSPRQEKGSLEVWPKWASLRESVCKEHPVLWMKGLWSCPESWAPPVCI